MKFQRSTFSSIFAIFMVVKTTSNKSLLVNAVHDETCRCDMGDDTAGTFKCGNEIYVCPTVERICAVQKSQNSVYYLITPEQCNDMKKVDIDTKCIHLEQHDITSPKDLSNRVCYNDKMGLNGMKEDGSCDVCNESIPFPGPPTTNTPIIVEGEEDTPETVAEGPTDPAPEEPADPAPAPEPEEPAESSPEEPVPLVPEPEEPTDPAPEESTDPAPEEPVPLVPEPEEPTNPAPEEPTDPAPEPPNVVHDGTCGCDMGDDTAGTFKCGNEIYVCPTVERICSVQKSQDSVYYLITPEQCNDMKKVDIDTKCIQLEQHDITSPKDLSNRVCYNDKMGLNGMKEDGSCDVCNESIPFPGPPTTNTPITVEGGEETPETVAEGPTDPVPEEPADPAPAPEEPAESSPEEPVPLVPEPEEPTDPAPEEPVPLVPEPEEPTNPAPEEPTDPAPEPPNVVHDGTCGCDMGDDTAGTFKCGNEIYVCPTVERICSVQKSQNSIYYLVTPEQCNDMKKVDIDTKCIQLEQHDITSPKDLSNRVCYNDKMGLNGMKEDGSCDVCNESIPFPGPPTTNTPIIVEGEEDTPETVAEGPTDPAPEEPADPEPEEPTDPEPELPNVSPPPPLNTKPPIFVEVEEEIPEAAIEEPEPLISEPESPITCPGDMDLIGQKGVTEEPGGAIKIISQDSSTVTVALNQVWTTTSTTTPSSADNNIEHIYYLYKESIWSSKCYEVNDVIGGGLTYDTVIIACNVLSPYAYMEICIVDNSFLSLEDNAIAPQCCYSNAPLERTPTVCYSYEIRCVSKCIDDVVVSPSRKLLRGGN